MSAISITPGEVVLGNRIRRCFPAHISDEQLPQQDDALVEMVRTAMNVTMLKVKNAALWVVAQQHKLHDLMEPSEIKLMSDRINSSFAMEKKDVETNS